MSQTVERSLEQIVSAALEPEINELKENKAEKGRTFGLEQEFQSLIVENREKRSTKVRAPTPDERNRLFREIEEKLGGKFITESKPVVKLSNEEHPVVENDVNRRQVELVTEPKGNIFDGIYSLAKMTQGFTDAIAEFNRKYDDREMISPTLGMMPDAMSDKFEGSMDIEAALKDEITLDDHEIVDAPRYNNLSTYGDLLGLNGGITAFQLNVKDNSIRNKDDLDSRISELYSKEGFGWAIDLVALPFTADRIPAITSPEGEEWKRGEISEPIERGRMAMWDLFLADEDGTPQAGETVIDETYQEHFGLEIPEQDRYGVDIAIGNVGSVEEKLEKLLKTKPTIVPGHSNAITLEEDYEFEDLDIADPLEEKDPSQGYEVAMVARTPSESNIDIEDFTVEEFMRMKDAPVKIWHDEEERYIRGTFNVDELPEEFDFEKFVQSFVLGHDTIYRHNHAVKHGEGGLEELRSASTNPFWAETAFTLSGYQANVQEVGEIFKEHFGSYDDSEVSLTTKGLQASPVVEGSSYDTFQDVYRDRVLEVIQNDIYDEVRGEEEFLRDLNTVANVKGYETVDDYLEFHESLTDVFMDVAATQVESKELDQEEYVQAADAVTRKWREVMNNKLLNTSESSYVNQKLSQSVEDTVEETNLVRKYSQIGK